MSGLRNLGKKFSEHHAWKIRRLVFWGAIVVVGAVVVVAAAFYFDHVTEGAWFCGALCHPNRPQGVAHEESPHASVECGTCHIGPGLWPKVEAKILGIGELVSLVFNSYDRPTEAPVERLKPADVICEQCHWPEKEYPERVHLLSEFAEDEANTETQTILSVYIGGVNQAGAAGAHWHVENTVWYASTDELHQEIPWVAVEEEDGTLAEYIDRGSDLSADELRALSREEMDCLDCHNRAAHQFRNPELVLDEALAAGRIDAELPFVKREAMALLSGSYPSQEEGVERMADLAEFYRSEYPTTYEAMSAKVEGAVKALEEIYHTTVFPEMNLTWDVYDDNLGHGESPGCFRCHDGEHVAPAGDSIPRDCTACHSLPRPLLAENTAPSPALAVSAEQPVSAGHVVPALSHEVEGREQCLMCHQTGALAVPASHEGIANEACTVCHLSSSAAAAPSMLGTDTAPSAAIGSDTGEADEDCIACHTSESLLASLAVEEPVVEAVGSCGAPPPNIPKAEKLLISMEFIEQDIHGSLSCIGCHGGQEGDVTSAHEGVVRDPSLDGEACRNCHTDIVDRYATALHNTLMGQITAVEARSHVGIMDQELAVMDEVDCATCHTTCGQCHISRPNPAKGGLVAGHAFVESPSMNEACVRCHGTSKEGGLYLADYGTGDVHWIQARMTCTDCHDGAELHGSGTPYTNRYEVEEAPACQDCHPQPGPDESGSHAIHQDKLSCYVCHSAGPVETCTGCHEGYNEDGTRFRTSDISYVFKIGTNPNPTERHPYEYVTVREVPTVPDTFEGFGVILENYDAVPSWKMSTPHNIRKTTRYSRNCDSCHGHPELFLSEEDLGPDPSDADLSVVVPNPPE